MADGFIKIYRSLLDWEWFDDANTLKLWLYILLRANWEERKWRGITIHRGQFVESLRTMAKKNNMTVQEVRTSLAHLKSTQNITQESTQLGSLISVIKWDFFQGQPSDINTPINTEFNKPSTQHQHSNKKYKEHIRRKEEREEASASFSPPSLSDIRSYIFERNSNVIAERFFDYYEARNWQGISDWKALLRSWETNERPEPQQTAKPYRVKELPEYMKGHEDIYD